MFLGNYSLIEHGYNQWLYIPNSMMPLQCHTGGKVYIINRTFVTDGATTPRFLWLIPGFAPMDWPKAAILHDWLWETKSVGFFKSNAILYKAIRSLGWSRPVALLCWLGVTLCGWVIWRKKR